MITRLCTSRGVRLARTRLPVLRQQQQQQRRSLATELKDAPAPPPPPPGAPPGGGMRKLLVVLVLGAAGAVYFEDEIRKQLGLPPATKGGIEGPKASSGDATQDVKALKAEVERLGGKLAEEIKQETRAAEEAAKAQVGKKNAAAAGSESGGKPQPQATPAIGVDYDAVREAIRGALDDENHDDGSYGPIFVRLAWHNAGTYDKSSGKGGSEGALMRFQKEGNWGANAGLDKARARLEPIKAQFPGITYSDLWSLAGTVAIEEMGGPEMPQWRAGRKDRKEDDFDLADGLLPDADGRGKAPAEHLRDIFYRMGFNDQEIVALSGAHALGRCHTTSSGYWGPWTRAPTTMSNEYFRLLLEEPWTPKEVHEGKPWSGPEQFEDTSKELMMLPTDLSLVQDDKFKPYVEKYAKDEEAFMKDFAKAWMKLQELGVRKFHGRRRYWLFGPRE